MASITTSTALSSVLLFACLNGEHNHFNMEKHCVVKEAETLQANRLLYLADQPEDLIRIALWF